MSIAGMPERVVSASQYSPKDEACPVVNKGLISAQISSFPCNQLHTGFVWILPLVNTYIRRRIQSFQHLMGYLLGCQQQRLVLIVLLWDNIDLPTLRM
jgi:hypothetical protein